MGKTNEENKTADIQQTDGQSPRKRLPPMKSRIPTPRLCVWAAAFAADGGAYE